MGSLGVLAVSDAALRGDLKELHAQAGRLVAAEPRLQSISLADAQGRQWLNTQRPFGAELLTSNATPQQQPVFAQARRIASGLLRGATSGRWVVGLAVPVQVDGRVTFALRGTLDLQALRAVLVEQRLPPDWTAALLDHDLRIVARVADHERFVGQSATASLRDFVAAGGRGVMRGTTQEGVDVLAAVAPVPGTGWIVAIGQPRAPLVADLRGSLLKVLVTGLLLVLLGMLASIYLVRQLAGEVRRAASWAPAPGDPHPVREMQALRDHMREAQRHAAQSAADLHDARHDALTRLPGRALFMTEAERLLATVRGDRHQGAALLFLDLDGFKDANDRLGHEGGDRVLMAVADVLRQHVRAGDRLGRVGGDEFVVLMPVPASQREAVSTEVAGRIVAGVRALGQGMGCTVGVAMFEDADTLPQLMERADQAMLAAKREGKNRVALAAA